MTISAEYKSKFAAGDVSIWMKNSRVEQTNKQTNKQTIASYDMSGVLRTCSIPRGK